MLKDNEYEILLRTAEHEIGGCVVQYHNLSSMQSTEQEFRQIIENFIDSKITEPELKIRLKESFKGFRLDFKSSRKELTDEHVRGAVGHKDGKLDKWSYAGWKTPNNGKKIIYTLAEVQTTIHELFHSVSSKHNPNVKTEKDPHIGETEAMFSEMLFIDALQNDAKSIIPESMKLDDNFIKTEAFKMSKKKAFDFKGHLQMSQKGVINHEVNGVKQVDGRETDRLRNDEFRYVVGEINAASMMDEYKKNPNKFMKKFSVYLTKDQTFTKDKVARFFGFGFNFPGAIGKFKKAYGQVIDKSPVSFKLEDKTFEDVEKEGLVDNPSTKLDEEAKKVKLEEYKTWSSSLNVEDFAQNIEQIEKEAKEFIDLGIVSKEDMDSLLKKFKGFEQTINDSFVKNQTNNKETALTQEQVQGTEKGA